MIARFHPVSRRRLAVLSLAVAAVAAVALTDAPAAADSANERAASRQTVQALREVGSAMFFELTEGVDDAPQPAGRRDTSRFDWSRCPRISHGDLEAILVPERLRALPVYDAWGHELEFCLDGAAAPAGHLVGVRSPGRDGEFEDEVYRSGPHAPDDVDRDLVWMDGFFVRWPEAR